MFERLLFYAVIVCCLSGCLGSMSGSTLSPAANLVIGQTTQAQVRQIYGNPTKVTARKSGSTWIYSYDAQGSLITDVSSTAVKRGISRASSAASSRVYGAMGGSVVGDVVSSVVGVVGDHVSDSVNSAFANKVLSVDFDGKGIVSEYEMR